MSTATNKYTMLGIQSFDEAYPDPKKENVPDIIWIDCNSANDR